MGELRCKCLLKEFKQGETVVRAVNNATLCFNDGIHMIKGKSGSGKSTLLHLLAGLERPTSGTVSFNSQNINHKNATEFRLNHFGFVFQASNLIPELSVRDNILLPLYLKRENADLFFDEVVDILGLRQLLSSMPTNISGGEQQRVAIARSILTRPQVVFADEPTGNLDRQNTDAVMNLLLEVCQENNTTLVMVTHDEDLLTHANYAYHMEDGRIDRIS